MGVGVGELRCCVRPEANLMDIAQLSLPVDSCSLTLTLTLTLTLIHPNPNPNRNPHPHPHSYPHS